MGGEIKINEARTKKSFLHTVNINKLDVHQLNPDAVGIQNSVFSTVIERKFKSKPIRTLLDTGASYSVININLLKQLANEGFQYEVLKTIRTTPISASNHSLQIIGDVILNLQFEGENDKKSPS